MREKKTSSLGLFLILVTISTLTYITLAADSFAGTQKKFTPKDKSPEEITRYLEAAVELVKKKGKASYDELTDPDGPWAEGDWYIYIDDYDGFVVAHINKNLVGKNLTGIRDVKGIPFYALLQEVAQSEEGKGWVEFWWPKPNETKASQKIGYVIAIPEQRVWVGTGIYGMSKEDVDRLFKK